jgi:biopolymer transport protein ExbB
MRGFIALPAVAASILLAFPALAKEGPETAAQRTVDSLRRELSALESLRAEKLETLEQKESARWGSRYKASAKTKEAEEGMRRLEDAFSRLASEASRAEEELIKARNDADAAHEGLEMTRNGRAVFAAQVKRRVDEAASSVSSDFPVGLEARTLAYSRASQALEGKNADLRAGLESFFAAGLYRLDLTLTRALETRQTVFEDGHAASAWRLRLGTLFLGELEKGGAGASQILLRTGNLQGRTFAWRQDLARDYNQRLREAVSAAAQGQSRAVLPFDVLQFKSTGSGFVRGEERSAWARFREWFKAGGVTLYPLFAVGILALLMICERLIFFARRATDPEAFMRKFWSRASEGDWNGAAALCAGSRSSLARVLGAVATHAASSREAAEKAVREVLLKEIPGHEKRLSLLSALGTAAPLLGLLGTVSGLVTLFKVLNQLGSNDPKVLAGGISEALVNTETGLAIAIPVLLVHGWLQERVDTLNAVLSAKSLEVMNKRWPQA